MLSRRRKSSAPGLTALAASLLLTLPVVADSPSYVIPAGDDGPRVYWFGDLSRAYLGVQLEEEVDHPDGGARVTEVVEDSPAEQAGIQVGDIIVRFEEKTIRGPAGLTKWIQEKEPGDRVEIVVLRGGRREELTAELGDRVAIRDPRGRALERLFDVAPRLERLQDPRLGCEDDDCSLFDLSFGGTPRLGVQLVETTPELREHLGGDEERGVLVSKVLSGMPAEFAGVRVGDLIVAVGDEPIGSVTDLRKALRHRGGESFTIEVVRDKGPITLDVTLPEGESDRPTGPRARFRAPVAPLPASAPAPALAAPRAPEPAPAPPLPDRRRGPIS